MRSFREKCFVTSMKNPGAKPIMPIVSIHQSAGGAERGGEPFRQPREAQNHEAASAIAEAARWSGW